MKASIRSIKDTDEGAIVTVHLSNGIEFDFELKEIEVEGESLRGFNIYNDACSEVMSLLGILKPLSSSYWGYRDGVGEKLPWIYDDCQESDLLDAALSRLDL